MELDIGIGFGRQLGGFGAVAPGANELVDTEVTANMLVDTEVTPNNLTDTET